MPHWIRVESKDDGAQFDVAASAFDENMHKKVNAPSQWPDLTGETDRPRPVVYRTNKAGQPATPSKGSDR